MIRSVSVHLLIICDLILFDRIFCVENNVCKSLEDYQNMNQNPNCWFNQDVEATPRQIIESHGFPFESHTIQTSDGYLLTVFRIPHNGRDINKKRPPVFLHHALVTDSGIWMVQGSESIAFAFANKGFDVWLANARGTTYSTHIEYTKENPEFWNFSFHEIALYDLPPIFEFIASKTGQKGNITYVGFSMGTTIFHIYASLKPNEAKMNLKCAILLAPVAYMSHVKGLIKVLSTSHNTVEDLLRLFGITDSNKYILSDLIKKLCPKFPFFSACVVLMREIVGRSEEKVAASLLPVLFSHFPAEFSLNQLRHYAQLINSENRFQFFDYGTDVNLKMYNSTIPPNYPTERIKVPVHLIYGTHDLLAPPEDAINFYNRLRTKKTIRKMANFTHIHFVVSNRTLELFKIVFR